jgi:hypothetical protein
MKIPTRCLLEGMLLLGGAFLEIKCECAPIYYCEDEQIHEAKYVDSMESGGLSRQGVTADWTTGEKKLLLMRVSFPDDPSISISEVEAYEMIRQVNAFYFENSYGLVSFSVTVTPVLRLLNPKAYYLAGGADYTLSELLKAGRAAAREAGFDTVNYDLDCVHNQICSPRAYVKMKGAVLHDNRVSSACHELGHNLGAWHANAWVTTDNSILGAGYHQEYGNPYDTMGSGDREHFNAYYKDLLNWLPEGGVVKALTDGVYRLRAIDAEPASEGEVYALEIPKDNERSYWIETRQHLDSFFPGNILVSLNKKNGGSLGTELLDAHPGRSALFDAPFVVGESFFDPTSGLKIIPLGKRNSDGTVQVLVKHVCYGGIEAESGVSTGPVQILNDSSDISIHYIQAEQNSKVFYAVNIQADGKYQILMRYRPVGTGPAAMQVEVDGALESKELILKSAMVNQWIWEPLLESSAQTEMTAVFSLAAGKHVIGLSFDSLVLLDSIMFTDDPSNGFPPVIQKIPDQVVSKGVVRISIPFFIINPATGSNDLQVTVKSSDGVLFSAANISLTGSNLFREIEMVPSANRTGKAVITVGVSRPGGYMSQTQFVLCIVENDPKDTSASSMKGDAFLTSNVLEDGSHLVKLTSATESSWALEGTTDFLNWDELVVMTTSGGSISYQDFSAKNLERRFYRAVRK